MNWFTKTANAIVWSGEIINRPGKERVAAQIAARVQDGHIIGVGSGSTVFLALQAIAERTKNGRCLITAIPTSYEISLTCAALRIPTTTLVDAKPDWSFDGADEVDPKGNAIKGRGGAMFKEKLLISSSSHNILVVDNTKLVSNLGQNFPVPIEVYPLALHLVEERLTAFGTTEVALRLAKAKDGPVITEAGNLILDVRFKHIDPGLDKEIKLIPGVIESGLFMDYDFEIITPDHE